MNIFRSTIARPSGMWGLLTALLLIAATIAVGGCRKDFLLNPFTPQGGTTQTSSGEAYLIDALDELEAISLMDLPSRRTELAKVASDTVVMYGAVSPEGTGMVVTERHTFPKGLPLITVRKSYGGPGGRVITGTWTYSSEADFASDSPDQWTISELYAGAMDTIVTRVTKNTGTEVYTFTLPVITRTTNTATGITQQTVRFARQGSVVSEISDGLGSLIRRTATNGFSNGAVHTLTTQADGSWRDVSTLGRADGTVLKTVTTGN
jgi:hypothetical protein